MKTILLVDDDQQLRVMLKAALEAARYRVIEADSGVAGLQMARRHLPDLILTDIQMPGGDGASFLRNIRQDPELRQRQVVLMTGKPDLVTPRKGMEEGADDFLLKPISLDALLSCVQARFSRASVNWRVEDQMLDQLRSSVPVHLPHEFFTPMAGIIGLMEILDSGYSTFTAEEVQAIHRDIRQSALRLNRTLRNYLLILDLQTATPGGAVKLLPLVDVETSFQAGVADALRLNNRREDVTVRIQACPISVNLDDLSQMVEELVDNACKFSRHGTPILIELNAEGRLMVTDEGRGLTSDEISRIGAFQQFDRNKYEQQGLGLGLILVQKLTARCGAKFSMNSQAGQGTQVQIDFPLASPT